MQLRELTVRYGDSLDTGLPGDHLEEPVQAARIFRDLIGHEAQEVFVALLVTAQAVPTGLVEISRGLLDTCPVHPREVFKAAVLTNSYGMFVAHNHPDSSVQPSQADLRVTRRLKECGKLLGIEVLDHFIIGATRYTHQVGLRSDFSYSRPEFY